MVKELVRGGVTNQRGGADANTPQESSRPPVVKLSFNVSQHQVDSLKRLADEKGVSMTEILRHAIALESYLQDEVSQGSRILVENPERDERREIVLIGP